MNRSSSRFLFLCSLVVLTFVAIPASAQILLHPKLKEKKKEHKDDVVFLDNGDHLTGEIKKMENGMLYIKSDRAIGTLQLDWERVVRVQSRARYEFEMKEGKRRIGFIADNLRGEIPLGDLVLNFEDGSSVQLKISEIVGIHEMQRNFWGRINLSVDAGITYTQGNKQTQTNVQTSLLYSQHRYSFSADVNSLFNSGQSEGSNTSRHELLFVANRHVSRMWDTIALAAFLHDNQQDLDLRTTLGGGLQRTFIKKNRTHFSGYGGFVYTRENYLAESEFDKNSGELFTGISLTTYRFRSSELETLVLVFPSVTDLGRVRVDTSFNWKLEIVKDLYWKLSFWDNFDSAPAADSPKNNFSVTSSVGWSF